MRTVGEIDLQKMNLSVDQGYQTGLQNIAKTLKPLDQVIQHLPPNGIGVLDPDPYQSSRILLHADWARVSAEFGNHLIVAIPSAELLFYADGSHPGAIDALATLARNRFAEAERPLSAVVYEWRADGWAAVSN